MEHIIILILFTAVMIFAGKYCKLKKQMKSIARQLSVEQTRLVTIEFIDKDLETVVLEINELLEKIQQTIIKMRCYPFFLKDRIIGKYLFTKYACCIYIF